MSDLERHVSAREVMVLRSLSSPGVRKTPPSTERIAPGLPPCSMRRVLVRGVYFVEGAGLMKIGHSSDVVKRLASHQCGSPVRIGLVLVLDGGAALEAELHRRFAGQRAHGEWFTFDGALRAFVVEHHDDWTPPHSLFGVPWQ